MSELLFEGYNVPSVTYGVDSLFSFYNQNPGLNADGLVVSSSTSSTHVIPVLGGQSIMTSAKKSVVAPSTSSKLLTILNCACNLAD
jgi:actin-related protein 5